MFLDFLTKEETNEILNEMGSSDLDEFKSRLLNLYFHMLKYQYQKEIQTSSWIRTIVEQSKQLGELVSRKSLKYKISDDIVNNVYDKALKNATNSSTTYEKRYGKPEFPSKLPNEYYLQSIIDSEYIYTFLIKYKYTQEAINYLDKML